MIKENFSEQEPSKKKKIIAEAEKELEFSFSGSSGPGGQNVNKREMAVEVRWDINKSQADWLNEERKRALIYRLQELYPRHITQSGEVLVTSQEQRSQHQNRQRALEKFRQIMSDVLRPRKERTATKKPKSVKKREEDWRKKEQKKKQEREKGKQEAKKYLG